MGRQSNLNYVTIPDMSNPIWQDKHQNYKEQDWINKPSIFAEQALPYFPKSGKILELGAGQAQDGCYFAEQGYDVTATDLEESAIELAKQKAATKNIAIKLEKVDMSHDLPFENESFDVVYAHLSLHYFNRETTKHLFEEAERVLRPGGMLAFLVNSVNDPEYKTGDELEPEYFQSGESMKRYYSIESTREFTKEFETILLDDNGETYKDAAKGVHNLIRFIGRKKSND